MEEEIPKKRNIRPKEKSNLPIITLAVLVLLVFAILYVGYEYISDDSSNTEELTSITVQPLDTTEELEGITETSKIEESKSTTTPVVKKEEAKPEPVKEKTKSVSSASIGGKTITHRVRSGDTWTNIAARYNLKLETLQGLNPDVTGLKADITNLKIQVKDTHTVGPGDVLRVVASKYGISKSLLMEANGKSKDYAARGEKLIIPFSSKK